MVETDLKAARTYRVLVADDHEIVRRGVCSLFTADPQCKHCAEAATGKEAVEQTLRLHPDVVILDVTMPQMNGLDAADEIRRTAPHTKIVILTMYEGGPPKQLADRLGVDAFVPKIEAASQLVEAVRRLVTEQAPR